jgi:FAD:protein FMN transferase
MKNCFSRFKRFDFQRVKSFTKVYGSISILLFFGKVNAQNFKYQNLSGTAQGTTYFISYENVHGQNYQIQIDSIFKVIDKSLSLWDSTSTLVRVNKNQLLETGDIHFKKMFLMSADINKITKGYFDARVGPLVNAWGFWKKNAQIKPNTIQIDSLRNLISKVEFSTEGKILKENPNSQLDFNAIAQGYTADVISNFLKSKNIKNYLIEIGGEVLAKGISKKGEYWKVGIENPDNEDEMRAVVSLKNKALATSGSYRKFWVKDGLKYSHAIDPFTGYPVQHNLLSVSVIAKDCATADAFATAFLVMGLEKAKKIAKNNKIEFFAIYGENSTFRTKRFGK